MERELKPSTSGRERKSTRKGKGAPGLSVPRYFTTPGVDPADEMAWELRTAAISGEDGKGVFEQKDVEVPKSWSMLATNVVASKYFRGTPGTPERESSVRKLVERVVDTITGWGQQGGYFATEADREAFHAELTHLLLRQKAAFNSPVWFNVGVEDAPPVLGLLHQLGRRLDGEHPRTGQDRGHALQVRLAAPAPTSRRCAPRKELLAGGGTASGPVSFMKGFDAFAGVIKSGGKTRRAAKMVILNADHPDIVEFIHCKASEEKKAWALIDAGYDGSFNGEAYASVFFQNSNNSVRVTDEFMKAVVEDRAWATHAVQRRPHHGHLPGPRPLPRDRRGGAPVRRPGHAVRHHRSTTGTPARRPRASTPRNPCCEYMFLDDSACNLASLNLMQFREPSDGELRRGVPSGTRWTWCCWPGDHRRLQQATPPTAITENSHAFRPLGPGLRQPRARCSWRAGLPYDSEQGRDYAAAITALMCGEAYRMSARSPSGMGPFGGYAEEPRADAARHRQAPQGGRPDAVPTASRPSCSTAQRAGLGRRAGSGRASTASATARSPCSRPPAPSAS